MSSSQAAVTSDPEVGKAAIAGMVAGLTPQVVGEDQFAFVYEAGGNRKYGGLLMAQSFVAAAQSVQGMSPHSLHAIFLRPGSLGEDTVYAVERLRDGRSGTTRRVRAMEGERLLCEVTVSFAAPDSGITYRNTMPSVPAPETLAVLDRWRNASESVKAWMASNLHEEYRKVSGSSAASGSPHLTWWSHVVAPIPDDPILQTAYLILCSDGTIAGLFGEHYDRGMSTGASLDHAIWFHHPPRVNDWLLYQLKSDVANNGRTLARGSLWTRDGEHIASIAQEFLVRDVGADEFPKVYG